MKDQETDLHPFAASEEETPRSTKWKEYRATLEENLATRSLGEIAVFLGLGAAIAFVLFLIVAAGGAVALHLSRATALFTWAFFGVAWLIFVAWWFALLARVAKLHRARVSDADLFWLQGLFVAGFTASIFAPPPKSFSWHDAFLVLEWIVIVFHALYFLLALGARLGVARWQYAVFTLLLFIAAAQTLLRK